MDVLIGPSAEARAWETLAARDPRAVEAATGAVFDAGASVYDVPCFGQAVRVSLASRSLSSATQVGQVLLGELGGLTRASILIYLATGLAAPRSGKLVKPADMKGGTIFVQGTHVLPLDALARRFERRPGDFLRRGRELGGTPLRHGGMAIELPAFPRLPVTLVVWPGDEEFPARASLLFDSGSSAGLAADLVWALANIAIALVMRDHDAASAGLAGPGATA